MAERLDQKFDEAFGPEHGHVSRALARHFGDESSVAVQNRVKAMLAEAAVQIREDLRKQFTADSDDNPLAIYQRASLAVVKQSSDQHNARLQEMNQTIQGLRLELERERAEKEKAEAVAQEAERGTAKGRSFEEAVYARARRGRRPPGRRLRRGRRPQGRTGKTGDVVVAIEGCTGPARGRIVFEAKASRLSKPKAVEELDRARTERNADYAVLVVPDEERIPAKMHELREYGGDKLVVCFDPEDGSTLSLEVAYKLARARVLMARGEAEGVDAAAIREAIERATGAMGDVLRVKQQLTGATTSIQQGRRDPRRDGRSPCARSSSRSSCCSPRASRRRRGRTRRPRRGRRDARPTRSRPSATPDRGRAGARAGTPPPPIPGQVQLGF